MFYDENNGNAYNAHVGVTGVTGVADWPLRLTAVEGVFDGATTNEATIATAEAATSAAVDRPDDIHVSGAYRKALVGVMIERALKSAAA